MSLSNIAGKVLLIGKPTNIVCSGQAGAELPHLRQFCLERRNPRSEFFSAHPCLPLTLAVSRKPLGCIHHERTRENKMRHTFWFRLLLALSVLIVAEGGTFLVLSLTGIAERDYSNVIINTAFLVACVGLVRVLNLSMEDIGLKVIKERLAGHVVVCLAIFIFYMAFYVFAIHISSLRPISSKTIWGLLNYLIVVFAEEIYFRGICYSIVQDRCSGRIAVVISALLFGLSHATQGLGMIPKLFTGWLWGTVRYTTGMIFLLIIPIHLAYNVVWLLFEGNWENPPLWAEFFPLFELLLGVIIMLIYARVAAQHSVHPVTYTRR